MSSPNTSASGGRGSRQLADRRALALPRSMLTGVRSAADAYATAILECLEKDGAAVVPAALPEPPAKGTRKRKNPKEVPAEKTGTAGTETGA